VTGEGLEQLLRRIRQEMDRLPEEAVEDGDEAEREIVVTLKERKR